MASFPWDLDDAKIEEALKNPNFSRSLQMVDEIPTAAIAYKMKQQFKLLYKAISFRVPVLVVKETMEDPEMLRLVDRVHISEILTDYNDNSEFVLKSTITILTDMGKPIFVHLIFKIKKPGEESILLIAHYKEQSFSLMTSRTKYFKKNLSQLRHLLNTSLSTLGLLYFIICFCVMPFVLEQEEEEDEKSVFWKMFPEIDLSNLIEDIAAMCDNTYPTNTKKDEIDKTQNINPTDIPQQIAPDVPPSVDSDYRPQRESTKIPDSKSSKPQQKKRSSKRTPQPKATEEEEFPTRTDPEDDDSPPFELTKITSGTVFIISVVLLSILFPILDVLIKWKQ